jgi:hypothetical protein
LKKLGEEGIRALVENVLATHPSSRENDHLLWFLVVDRYLEVHGKCSLCNQKCPLSVKLSTLRAKNGELLYRAVQSSLSFHAIVRNRRYIQNKLGMWKPSKSVAEARMAISQRIKGELA